MQERRRYKGIGFWLLTMFLAVAIGTGVSKTEVYATAIGIPYIDENGDKKQEYRYLWITDTTTELTGGTKEDPAWYVVKGSITTGESTPVRINVSGVVNLILEDGASWTANGGLNVQEGGTFTVYGQEKGTGKLTAQNVKSANAGIGGEENASIIINGGDITATGNNGSAGIGNNARANSPTNLAVTIHGGKIEATGGSEYSRGDTNCAGIGGNTITIEGGIITANGGEHGAGIGSCSDKADVTIQVSGGDITAIGGVHGAGIGGVEDDDCGEQLISITITGGKVMATGTSAPGIGASNTFKQCEITITNGEVTADGLAGIGGGIMGSKDSKTGTQIIRISGGTVNATGSKGGAGIGGRHVSSGGNIKITGGRIMASTTGTGWGNAPVPAIGDGSKDDINYPYTPGMVNISGMKMVKAGEDADSASDTEYAKRSAWWQETTDEAGTTTAGLQSDLHYVVMEECKEDFTWKADADTLKQVCELCGKKDESKKITLEASAKDSTITYLDTTTLTAGMKDESGKAVTDVITYAWYLDDDLDHAIGTGATYTTPDDLPAGEYTYTVKATYEKATATTTVTVNVGKRMPVIKELPQADAIVYGDTLEKSSLSGGSVVYSDTDATLVKGTFRWKESSVKPTVADSNTTAYAVVFTPTDTANYEEVETTVTVEVHKAATVPGIPAAEQQVANTCKQVADVSLPKNWNWSEKDQSKALVVGKAITATAEYTGEDKENYETLIAEVSVTRAACEEDPSVYYTGEGEKAPTCTEPGTGHTICKLCGDLLREKVVAAAAGHKWNDGIVTTQPTTKAEGVKTYTCTVCGAIRTETVPKKEETKVTITAKKPVKKGDVVKSDTANAVFTVTNTKKAEVTYKKPFTVDGTIKTITIPDIVTINGKKYKVTAISKNAFKNNKKVTEVSVGKNVTSIGESAFSGCTALRNVTLDEKVTTIGKNAFKGCKNLKRIVIRSTKLNKKNVKKGAFKGISSKAVIEVPKKKRSAYKKLFRQKGLSKKVKFK